MPTAAETSTTNQTESTIHRHPQIPHLPAEYPVTLRRVVIPCSLENVDYSKAVIQWAVNEALHPPSVLTQIRRMQTKKPRHKEDVTGASPEEYVVLLYAWPENVPDEAFDGNTILFDYAEFVQSVCRQSMEDKDKERAVAVVEAMKQLQQILEAKKIMSEIFIYRPKETMDVREAIVDYVEKVQADLVIMGAHDYPSWKRTLIGSTADYVMHNTTKPTILVKVPQLQSAPQ